ncbi:hypothetical protein BS47DRAFT_1343335, partial [Hydnum rufescens UP504]
MVQGVRYSITKPSSFNPAATRLAVLSYPSLPHTSSRAIETPVPLPKGDSLSHEERSYSGQRPSRGGINQRRGH